MEELKMIRDFELTGFVSNRLFGYGNDGKQLINWLILECVF